MFSNFVNEQAVRCGSSKRRLLLQMGTMSGELEPSSWPGPACSVVPRHKKTMVFGKVVGLRFVSRSAPVEGLAQIN